MPIEYLDALDDPRLEPYRLLPSKKTARRSRRFIAEGEKVVDRLLTSSFTIESVLLGSHRVEAYRPLVPADVPALVLPMEQISALVGFQFHRGVMACARRPAPLPIEAIGLHHERALLAACPAIQDPENLGVLMRTAAALGVSGLLLGPDCADPFSRRALRVSMGAALQLPIVETAQLELWIERLRRDHGYWALATVVRDPAALPLESIVPTSRMIVLFGNEAHGLDEAWLNRCDCRVSIPIGAHVDSLNLSIAAGIVLHWLSPLRQHADS